jgi:DNA-binding NarL/FixJ family response regulator
MSVVNGVSLSATSPVARFRLGATECVVVVLVGQQPSPDALGTFAVDGQRYAILAHGQCAEAPDLVSVLTPRELEIAQLVAGGYDVKVIARRLRISFHTVRVHLGRIYAKLGLHKQTELAARIAARFSYPMTIGMMFVAC